MYNYVMCMSTVNPSAPGVPYHWKEHYVNFSRPFTHPGDFVKFTLTPVRERDLCLLDKKEAYTTEPHVIPLGNQPKFGLNLYALGIEIVILAVLLVFAVLARRRAARTKAPSGKRLWRSSSYLLFGLAILCIGGIVYYSLYRLGLLGQAG